MWEYNDLGVFVQGGWSALMWAAYKGRVEVAHLLLEKGANPNITGQVRTAFSSSVTTQVHLEMLRDDV